MPYSREPFNTFLRSLSKEGFYQVLQYVRDNDDEPYYNKILAYCLSKKIVSSRSQVTVIVNSLTKLQLLQRNVIEDRPIRTHYALTDKGRDVLELLEELESRMNEENPA